MFLSDYKALLSRRPLNFFNHLTDHQFPKETPDPLRYRPIYIYIYIYEHFSLFTKKGGGAQLGPLGTSATVWLIVPVPGDYDDGEFGGLMIGRGNRSTRRKLSPTPLCLPQIPLDQTPASNPGRLGGKPATNRLSYGLVRGLLQYSTSWDAY
jgi:hypothetical protein